MHKYKVVQKSDKAKEDLSALRASLVSQGRENRNEFARNYSRVGYRDEAIY